MTDKPKCPFCGQKLECCGTYTDGTKKLWCDNCGLFGDNRLFEELIRTRKALDIAWDGLKKIGSGNIIEHSVVGHENDNKIFLANKTIDEIKTALEQKETK